MEEGTPLVFVSYSHDSPDHKKWVAELATKLLGKGIDVILDQWDLRYGDDVPKFMERGVREADRVLIICTEPYVNKSNEGKGGVGYEAMIVTGELVRDLGTSKFIPIIKQDSADPKLPVSISTRFYINLTDEKIFDEEFEKLLRELHGTPPVKKPPLGENPFLTRKVQDIGAEKESAPESDELSREDDAHLLTDDAVIVQYYENAFKTARSSDLVQWRKLVQKARGDVNQAIQEWRSTHERSFPNTWQEILPIAMSGAATYAPLIAIALAGVQSGQTKFNNQRAILDDILYPRNWNRSGRTILVDFPTTLAFVYQGLHGAVCLATDQLDTAIKLVNAPIEFPGMNKSVQFWRHHGAMGWPEAFEGKCTTGWSTLSNLIGQWNWLTQIFGDVEEYKAALCAYYMALNVYEYVDTLESGNIKALSEGKITLEIPLCYESENDDIKRRAYRLLTSDPDVVMRLWRSRGIDDNVVKENWAAWINVCAGWIGNVYKFGFHSGVSHGKLLRELLG